MVTQGSQPPGHVPPQPTHPSYGYLTPEELAEIEAQEREQGEIRARAAQQAGLLAAPTGEATTAWVPSPPAQPWIPVPVVEAVVEPDVEGEPAAETGPGGGPG